MASGMLVAPSNARGCCTVVRCCTLRLHLTVGDWVSLAASSAPAGQLHSVTLYGRYCTGCVYVLILIVQHHVRTCTDWKAIQQYSALQYSIENEHRVETKPF